MEQELATIKRPNEVEFITEEEYNKRIKETARCRRDIIYFAEHYFRIVSLDKGLQVIELYEKQKEMLRHMISNDRSVICASRQIGKCVFKDTLITVRNKKTGLIETLTVEEFFNRFKK